MEVRGKVALVTGAARRVGRAIAMELAAHGAAAAIHYRGSRDEAGETAAEIAKRGGQAQVFQADLEQVASIEQLVADVLRTFGRIDILVNSASVFHRTPIEEVTERDWDMHLDTNLKAPFFLSKLAGAAMRKNGAGKIVNIGDWAGIRPYNNYLPYTVSKSGLIGLTRALAKALAPEVQVNCVALGPVIPPEGYSEEEVARLAAGTLVKRIGSPEEVAHAVLYFCENGDFATGSTLLLDGGRLLA
ncbi:MAG: SDR family oxidoreductase [Candidatus Binataceae bacterium]